jgi:autotransporter adhesin
MYGVCTCHSAVLQAMAYVTLAAFPNSFCPAWASDLNLSDYAIAAGANPISVGNGSAAGGANSVAVGILSRANGANTTTIGNLSAASGDRGRRRQHAVVRLARQRAAHHRRCTRRQPNGRCHLRPTARCRHLESQVADNCREARATAALALATAGSHYDLRPGKASLAAAFGNYKGLSGLAVGLSYAVSDRWRLNAAFTSTPQVNDYGLVAGASWTLN